MQKMLGTHETYFSGNTLSLFITSLVVSNLQPIIQANMPHVATVPQPPVPSLPDWLQDGDTFLETFRPIMLSFARALHMRVARFLSVSLDDLVQEGLIAVWECCTRYDATKTPNEYAFRAYCKIRSRGAMVDYVRRLGRDNAFSLDAYLSGETDTGDYQREIADTSLVSSAPTAQALALRQRLRASLESLTLREQQAIKAAFGLEDENGVGHTLNDMVVSLQIKKKSLHETKSRALRKLAILLADQGVQQ